MQIVTGYTGESHITSNDDQGRNQGTFGSDSYALNVGNVFAITTVSANEFQIADGEAVHQGVHFRVDPGSYDTITIENGTQGMYRKDLIVARYTKNASTGVESVDWVVIQGEEDDTSATAPDYTEGDILAGDYTADMPMYQIALDGVNVDSVTALFDTLVPMATLQSRLTTAESDIDTLETNLGGYLTKAMTSCYIENTSGIYAYAPTDVDGYTPIGIIGLSSIGATNVFDYLYDIIYSASVGVRVGWRTNTLDTSTIGINVWLLYVKDM